MRNSKVLIIDDEPDIRELLEITLGRMELETDTAEDLASARKMLDNNDYNLCLTDMKLPDGNGLSIVDYIQEAYPNLPVAVITAFGSMDIAINALKAGAFDFISKPIDLTTLRGVVTAALNLQTEDNSASHQSLLTGESQILKNLQLQITKVARSQAPVYIHGESGSGKELVAREIHNLGSRAKQPFIAINCGAIPRELMESEFFGHKKGSFTGATSDKAGLFQAAHGGTIFLDEIAELPLDMQVKLLRTIQEKTVRPIGAEKETAVDVRILSATHRDLELEVENNRFRQDLFFRINVIKLDVPALRQRSEDIPLLCKTLLQKMNQSVSISDEAMASLSGYNFPGNVRELENILERACTLSEGNTISSTDLNLSESDASNIKPAQITETNNEAISNEVISTEMILPADHFTPNISLPEFQSLNQYLESIEKEVLQQALEENRWNKTAAAKQLGVTFRQLRYRLKKLELD